MDYKYIKRFGSYRKARPSNTDDSVAKKQFVKSGFFNREVAGEMLFDLGTDPCERVNLIDDPSFADVRKEMESRLNSWMERTEDPLLKGKMIPPDGALVNYPDSLSPSEQVFINNWNELD